MSSDVCFGEEGRTRLRVWTIRWSINIRGLPHFRHSRRANLSSSLLSTSTSFSIALTTRKNPRAYSCLVSCFGTILSPWRTCTLRFRNSKCARSDSVADVVARSTSLQCTLEASMSDSTSLQDSPLLSIMFWMRVEWYHDGGGGGDAVELGIDGLLGRAAERQRPKKQDPKCPRL